MSEQRYRLVRDNDGHSYVIKDEDYIEFTAFMNCNEYDFNETKFSKKFEDCRLHGSPENVTFTDPHEDL